MQSKRKKPTQREIKNQSIRRKKKQQNSHPQKQRNKTQKEYDVKGKITSSCYTVFVANSEKNLYYLCMPGWS